MSPSSHRMMAAALLLATTTLACDELDELGDAAFPPSPPGVADERATLVEGSVDSASVIVDGDRTVFWEEIGAEKVFLAEGSAPPTVVVDNASEGIEGVALDGSTLYYTTDRVPARLVAVDLASGTETEIAQAELGNHRIVVVGDRVVVAQNDGLSGGDGRILAIAVADGTQTELATGLTNVTCLATDGDAAWFCSGARDAMTVSVVGMDGTRDDRAVDQFDVGGIAISGGHAYWINDQDLNVAPGSVRRVALDGSSPVEDLATFDSFGERIAANGTHVYYEADGAVMQLPLAGGDPIRFFNLNQGAGVDGHLGLWGLAASSSLLAMGNGDGVRVISSP